MGKRRLRLVIPPMTCVPGCTDCCGVVPATAGEIASIRSYVAAHGITALDQGVTCPFAQAGRCAVYPVRPRVCQAFGHDAGRLQCPHGRNVNVNGDQLRAWVLAPGMPVSTLHRAFVGRTY